MDTCGFVGIVFLLGERKSRKSVQVFFSHKTAPGKMKIFLRSHEEVDGEEMIFIDFPFSIWAIFEVMFSCL